MSETTPVNSIGANTVQGVQPEGPPVVRGTFAGCPVFDVDSGTFYRCLRGTKTPQQRWKRFVDTDTTVGRAIRDFSYQNPGKSIIVHEPSTGQMSFVKRGYSKSKPR